MVIRAGPDAVAAYDDRIMLAKFGPGSGTEDSLPASAELKMDTSCSVSPEGLGGEPSVDYLLQTLGGGEMGQHIDFRQLVREVVGT